MSEIREEEKGEKRKYQFRPDTALKRFLTEISTPRLIGIINEILGTDYLVDSAVDFGRTEFFSITGDLENNSRRCDLVVEFEEVDGGASGHKTLIELQSTKDSTMGFRMLVYSLNLSQEDKGNKIYTLPDCFTLYTTLDVPEKGVDQAFLRFPRRPEELIPFEVPYYNVLGTEFEDFAQLPLELLKILYLYRYRKDSDLLEGDREKFRKVTQELHDFAMKEEGVDHLAICGILADLLTDIAGICEEKGYKEELKMMEDMNKSYSQTLMEQAKWEGKLEGIVEGKIEVAKNLFGKMEFPEIAKITGLSLSQVEGLRGNI